MSDQGNHSFLWVNCPGCERSVRYDPGLKEWFKPGPEPDIYCKASGIPGTRHKEYIDARFNYVLSMDGINGLISLLAGPA